MLVMPVVTTLLLVQHSVVIWNSPCRHASWIMISISKTIRIMRWTESMSWWMKTFLMALKNWQTNHLIYSIMFTSCVSLFICIFSSPSFSVLTEISVCFSCVFNWTLHSGCADQDATAAAADLEQLDIEVAERARLDDENQITEIDDELESQKKMKLMVMIMMIMTMMKDRSSEAPVVNQLMSNWSRAKCKPLCSLCLLVCYIAHHDHCFRVLCDDVHVVVLSLPCLLCSLVVVTVLFGFRTCFVSFFHCFFHCQSMLRVIKDNLFL